MNKIEEINPEEIDKGLESLDKWIDAIKDIVIVSFGLVASFMTLASGSTIDVALMLIILGGAILSSVFLPYKIAVTKKSILGVFSRYRAVELMLIVIISWLIPTALFLLVPDILVYITSQSDSQIVNSLLLLSLPFISSIFSGLFGQIVVLGVLRITGVPSSFFESYEKYPWGVGGLAPIVVSQTVLNTQLYLIRAAQILEQSADLAISLYSRSFGALIVLIMLCCSLTYYEPKRILTLKGEILFGLIASGLFVALWNPILGLLVSFGSIVLLIWYSFALPPIDVDAMIEQEQRIRESRKLNVELLQMKYGTKARILRYTRATLLYISIIAFMILIVLESNDESPLLFVLSLAIFISGFVLYIFESHLEHQISAKKYEYFAKCVQEGTEISAEGILEYLGISTKHPDRSIESSSSE